MSYVRNDSRKIKTVNINRFIKVTKFLLVRLGKFNSEFQWIQPERDYFRLEINK